MIVADTSAWVEHLRGSDHPVGLVLEGLLERQVDVAVTEVVIAELLGGMLSRAAFVGLRERLLSLPMLPLEGFADFEEAALLYRSCRLAGETPRGIVDCLIAVPAMKAGAEILHKNRDFDVIARHSPLKIYRPR